MEFPDYPHILKQAVSVARLLLDPLAEYSHLCNVDEDILCVSYHPLQNEINKVCIFFIFPLQFDYQDFHIFMAMNRGFCFISTFFSHFLKNWKFILLKIYFFALFHIENFKDDLLSALSLEFINRVNEVGVDVNHCLEFPHTASLLQFVCGFGPRKAVHLLKILKQKDNLLGSRTKLVTDCNMGPKVFMNCAGFIKLDTTKVGERTDAYVEVLFSNFYFYCKIYCIEKNSFSYMKYIFANRLYKQ